MICEWCESEMDPFSYGGGLRYCSNDCYNRAIQYAAEVLDAHLDGEDPPTRVAFKTHQQRARKWTPDKMRQRVAELKARAD